MAVMTQQKGSGARARGIRVAGEHQQLTLPGMLWPAGRDRARSTPLFFEAIDKKQANELIASWGHPLGDYNRSFGYQAYGLAIDGQAVAVTVSGSTVGNTSAGYSKYQVVDLARIARHPDHPGVMRVMLRLWRDYLAGRWDYWDTPVHAAVSYALPGKEGNLYRFDGWKFYGKCGPGRRRRAVLEQAEQGQRDGRRDQGPVVLPVPIGGPRRLRPAGRGRVRARHQAQEEEARARAPGLRGDQPRPRRGPGPVLRPAPDIRRLPGRDARRLRRGHHRSGIRDHGGLR